MDKRCVECGSKAHHDHHVIPKSLGGTFTVPLCTECHAKVHGLRAMWSGELIKAGMARAKARGVKVGRRNKEIDPIAADSIKRQVSEGKPVAAIARETGVSRQRIYRIIAA